MDGREPHSRINDTTLAEGPWGRKNWSQQLNKSPNSYIKFLVWEGPGGTNSFTMLAWLYIASANPAQASKPGSWGLSMNLVFEGRLPFITLQFAPKPLPSEQKLIYEGLEKKCWNSIVITFDSKKELATLWVNDLLVESVKTTLYTLVFLKRLWIGSKVENIDSPHLTMRVSCVQFFTVTLTRAAMERTKFVCKGKMKNVVTELELWSCYAHPLEPIISEKLIVFPCSLRSS